MIAVLRRWDGKIARDIVLSAHAAISHFADPPGEQSDLTREVTQLMSLVRSLDRSNNIKRKKKCATFRFSSRRPVSSPPSGLDQQHPDWRTITTSMQTHTLTDANMLFWAIVRGIP